MFVFSVAFALAVIVTLVSGVWLVIHLTAVARFFSGKADIIPSPKRPAAPRSRVMIVLALFLLGLAATIGLQILAMTSDAGAVL